MIEVEGRTIDGFILPDRDQFFDTDDHVLQSEIIERFIELAMRHDRAAAMEVLDNTIGCLSRAHMPPQYRPVTPEESESFGIVIATVLGAFRRSFPLVNALMLIPGLDADSEELASVAVIAVGPVTSKLLWRHGRAADDEAHMQCPEGADQMVQITGEPLTNSPQETFAQLDEACGYYGINHEELGYGEPS